MTPDTLRQEPRGSLNLRRNLAGIMMGSSPPKTFAEGRRHFAAAETYRRKSRKILNPRRTSPDIKENPRSAQRFAGIQGRLSASEALLRASRRIIGSNTSVRKSRRIPGRRYVLPENKEGFRHPIHVAGIKDDPKPPKHSAANQGGSSSHAAFRPESGRIFNFVTFR